MEKHRGSCLCGAVTFEIDGPLKPPDACHCTQCRKSTGHYLVGTDVPRTAFRAQGMDHVTWFASSAKVNRGFCRTCGATMFFDPPHKDWIGVSMGALDTPTNTHIEVHIFVAEKGDYYEIADGVPQHATIPAPP